MCDCVYMDLRALHLEELVRWFDSSAEAEAEEEEETGCVIFSSSCLVCIALHLCG